jgi:hypothetical protein
MRLTPARCVGPAALISMIAALAPSAPVAQPVHGVPHADRSAAAAPSVEAVQVLRVTDARLAHALGVLVSASTTAAAALGSLSAGGLPVVIGTPAQLAALPGTAGGPDDGELHALLYGTESGRDDAGSAVASVVFRAASSGGGPRSAVVERAWIAVEVDSVEAWVRRAGYRDAEERIHHDLLAILAHEFVAHVGSVAGTRRMADLCDDPTPAQRRRSGEARARGEAPPLDGEMASCALRVENRVRREVNRALGLRAHRALPPRYSYSLESMNFARALH